MAGGRRWTPAEDAVVMAARLTSHTERYAGPHPKESLAAVAARLGRTLLACQTRRDRLERKAGRRGLWTTQGLWTPEEDKVVLLRDGPDSRIAKVLGRTKDAVRTRRCKLKRLSVQIRHDGGF